ncbi:hypothetical protein Tsubulata_022055, partial [Turnera subulata]
MHIAKAIPASFQQQSMTATRNSRFTGFGLEGMDFQSQTAKALYHFQAQNYLHKAAWKNTGPILEYLKMDFRNLVDFG